MAISRGSTSSISLGLPKFQSISDTTVPVPGSIPDTPVFHYDAGNASSYSGSGSTFTDISGNSRNGSITGASFTSAGVASYFQCNGTSAHYISGTTTGVATPAFSVEHMVNFQDFTDGYYIVMTNSGADPEVRWECVSGNSGASIGRLNYIVYDSSAYLKSGNVYVTPALAANTWYHIVHTVNSTTGKTYINGTLTATVTHINGTYSGHSSNNATEMTFGTYNSPGAGYGGYANFRFNMARWYNKVLSQDEVRRNFNDLKGRFNISGY
jgi:hypothetical protein